MDVFKRVFGRKEDAEKGKEVAMKKTEDAMKLLVEKSDFCTKKLEVLQKQVDDHTTVIKNHLSKGEKEKAKMQLKRKKILETQITAVQNNQDRIMEQIMSLDMSQNNIITVQALSQAAEAGKANLKANDLENVEEVLDNIADQNDQMDAIQQALAQPSGQMAQLDQGELDDELAELEAETQDEQAAKAELQQMALENELNIPVPHTQVQVPQAAQAMPAAPQRVAISADGGGSMPSVPTHKATAASKNEEDELNDLMGFVEQKQTAA